MKNTIHLPLARPWGDYPVITIDDVLERFPELESSWVIEDEDGREVLRDYYQDSPFILVEEDISVLPTQLAELKATGAWLVVDGSLDVIGAVSCLGYVSGDLRCDSIQLTGSACPLAFAPNQQVEARHFAEASAEDHESMLNLPTVQLDTPHLFLWFCKIDNLALSDKTIIYIQGDWDYCESLPVPNLAFPWHTSLQALAPEWCCLVSGSVSDQRCWDTRAIGKALAEDRSIFKAGFDTACMAHMATGDEAMSIRDWPLAWAAYGEAARLSPGYSPAWYKMGEALYNADGYEQAMACYLEAARHFPPDQGMLLNDGLVSAAHCALRLQQWQKAIDLATQSIVFNQAAGRDSHEDFAFAYSVRGEARLLMARDTAASTKAPMRQQDVDAAGEDLRKALELDKTNDSINWILGLWHFLRGELALAQSFHARARREIFAPWYDVAFDTNALFGAPAKLEWAPMASRPNLIKDEQYWCQYLASTGLEMLSHVPRALQTAKVCLAAIKGRSGWLRLAERIPQEAFTQELAEHLVRASGANLRYIPASLLSQSLCLLATETEGQFNAKDLPAALFDEELARHAIACGASLADIPRTLVTRELCLQAIRRNEYALESVPPKLIDDECYVTAIAFGGPYFFDNKIPFLYKKTAMLKRAIDLDKRALDTISGHAFNREVFEYAQAKYGADDDWPEILARHSPNNVGEDDAAEKSWEALWDEQFIIEQLNKKNGYKLSSWEIPKHRYSQAVADAAFHRDPIHLDKIPRQYIQPWMVERFAASYPDMLERIPVALRTPKICAAAVTNDVSNLLLVPLAHRSVELCYQAMIDCPDYDEAIPLSVFPEVFDRLLNTQDAHSLYRSYLLICRGNGYASRLPPDLARALADYQAVLDEPVSEDKDYIEEYHQQAYYGMAYCYHQLGQNDEAQACLDKLSAPEAWPVLGSNMWDEPHEPVDFDKTSFDNLMYDIDRLKKTCSYDLACTLNAQAESMLADAGSNDRTLWAYVLDNKRLLTYELERWEDNEAACREIIERLDDSDLWHYLDGNNVIRHTLRSARYRLALLDISDKSSPEDLETCYRSLKDDIFGNVGATEDDAVLDPFLEGYAWVLLLLSRHRNHYDKEAMRVLKRIKSSNLVENNALCIPEVLDALA